MGHLRCGQLKNIATLRLQKTGIFGETLSRGDTGVTSPRR